MSVRVFCLTPDGIIYRVSLVQVDKLSRYPKSVTIREFAGCCIRFVEYIVQLTDKKIESINRVVYYLRRFDDNGNLDYKDYEENLNVHINAMWDDAFNNRDSTDNVIHMENKFKKNRGLWRPTHSELNMLDDVVFGITKVKKLKLDRT